MKVTVQSVHFDADSKLIAYIERKLSRLSRLFDRIESVEVLLRLQDTGAKMQDKISEIKVHIPGGWLIDKKTGASFETAVTASVDTLKRQLVKQKDKQSEKKGRRA